jgi:hypothetical protein
MSDIMTTALALIASADHFEFLRLKNAVDRRERQIGRPQVSPAQAKAVFPPNSFIEIGRTTNQALNGAVAKVIEVNRTTIRYEIDGTVGSIPTACAAPVNPELAQAALASQKPVAHIAGRVRVPSGKYAGAIGIIIRQTAKKFTAVLVDGDAPGIALTGTHSAFEALPNADRAPHLLVSFKNEINERDPYGTVTITDTNKVDPTTLRKIGTTLDGEIRLPSYITQSEARVLAKGLGARFEST